MKKVLFALLLVIFTACAKHEIIDRKTITIDPTDWADLAMDLSNHIDSVEVIPLETREDNLVGSLGQIERMGEYLIVLDKRNQRILAFDSCGKYKHSIGNQGKGPGEFIATSGFMGTPDNHQIAVNVMQKRSLMHYSLKGEFIKETKLPAMGHKLAFFNDTLIAIHCGRMGYNGGKERNFELWIANTKGDFVNGLFPFNDPLTMDYCSNITLGLVAGTVLYTKMADYHVYQTDGYQVDTLYSFDFAAANLDTAQYLKKENFHLMRSLPDKIQGFTTITNTQKDLLAGFAMGGKSKAMILVNHETGHHRYFPIDSTGMGSYLGIPLTITRWADNTHRYCQIPAFSWVEIVNKLSNDQKIKCREKIKGFHQAEEITETDNPIILRFRFKSF